MFDQLPKRPQGGFVQLFRQNLTGLSFQQRGLYCLLLSWADFDTYEVQTNETEIYKETGMTPSTFRFLLKELKAKGLLDFTAGRHTGTRVALIKGTAVQLRSNCGPTSEHLCMRCKDNDEQENEALRSNCGPTAVPLYINIRTEEQNKGSKEPPSGVAAAPFIEAELVGQVPKAKGRKPKPLYETTEFQQSMARDWLAMSMDQCPTGKWKVGDFEQGIAEVMQKEDISDKGFYDLFMFIRKSDFWRPNCLSPNRLLTKSKNGARKLDNITSAWMGKHGNQRSQAEEILARCKAAANDE